MDELQPETLKLPDAIVTLYRGQKFMQGAKELFTADRMLVEYHTGNSNDVVVLKEEGKLRVKKVVRHMQIVSPTSSALNSTVTFPNSLADLDEKHEKRLLAIYKQFRS